MAQSEKPKIPPTPQHRSSGDTGVPQHGDAPYDDPRQANESGEPGEANRSRGRVIDDAGAAAGKPKGKKNDPTKDEHWDSGRHKAQ